MIRIPAFRPDLVVRVVEGEGVFLLSERGSSVLPGLACTCVARLVDGERSTWSIAEACAEHISPQEAHYVLLRMERDGLLIEAESQPLSPLALFWKATDVQPPPEQLTITMTSLGTIPALRLATVLTELGFSLTQEDTSATLHIVLTDDYLASGLTEVNVQALRTGTPWLLVKPVGTVLWLGPLFFPGETGCGACLAQRLRGHRPLRALALGGSPVADGLTNETLAALDAEVAASQVRHPSSEQAALHLAAITIGQAAAQGNTHPLVGHIHTLDLATLRMQTHRLTRRPQCSVCGSAPVRLAGRAEAESLPLQSRPIASGTARVCPPEETYDRYRHHISPITGVIRRLRRAAVESAPEAARTMGTIYTYSASHALAPVSGTRYRLPAYLRDQSGGKGTSAAEARTSALCEALERYSGIFQGDEPRFSATAETLGEEALRPDACMHFSAAQYADRAAWNGACKNPFLHVPEVFDPQARMEWTPVRSLHDGTTRYLATAYGYYGYNGPHADTCLPDSNGCAAGKTYEEAVIQGFCEVVERDAVSLWWYHRLHRPGVDLASVRDPYVEALMDAYRKLGRQLWVLDLTADLSLPTFAALSRRTEAPTDDVIFGFGTHLDARRALLRALTEMNQLLPVVSQHEPYGQTRYAYDDPLAQRWWRTACLDTHPYLAPDDTLPLQALDAFPAHTSTDLLDDVQHCLDLAAAHGLDVLVLDQTRPDIGLPVVKVVIPEMRIFWRRLGPGRLYEVPIALGWQPHPMPEPSLNPFPFFL